MMNNLMVFEYKNNAVRTVMVDGDPWFVAKDVCVVLGLSNITESLKRVSKDDFSSAEVTDAIGRKQLTYIVNEYGIYDLVFESRKPEAKVFKRWVTHEVLPSLRKTGQYS